MKTIIPCIHYKCGSVIGRDALSQVAYLSCEWRMLSSALPTRPTHLLAIITACGGHFQIGADLYSQLALSLPCYGNPEWGYIMSSLGHWMTTSSARALPLYVLHRNPLQKTSLDHAPSQYQSPPPKTPPAHQQQIETSREKNTSPAWLVMEGRAWFLEMVMEIEKAEEPELYWE